MDSETLVAPLIEVATNSRRIAPAFGYGFAPDISADSAEPSGHDDISEHDELPFDGLTFAIEYQDGRGRTTQRRITARRVEKQAGFIFAFCHEAAAPRKFLIERIKAIIDWRTGEVFSPPGPYLERLFLWAGQNLDQVVLRCQDGLRILMYLARADHVVLLEEIGVIRDYLDARGIHGVAQSNMIEYAKRLYPSSDAFAAALRRLAHVDLEHLDILVRYASRLVEVDGEYHPDEFAAMADMRDILSQWRVTARRY